LFPRRARHNQVARQQVVQRRDIGRALNVGVTAQGHNAATWTAHISQQGLQNATSADDLNAKGMLRPANSVGEVSRSFSSRILDQRVGNFEEEVLWNPANLLDHLWRITRIVAFQNLQNAARVLHGFITFDLAGMRVREQSLALLSIGHDVLFVVMAGCPFPRGGGLAGWFVGWLARFPLFGHFILPARGIVLAVVRFQARENSTQVLSVLKILAHDEGGIRICLHIFLKVQVVLENVVDEAAQKSNIGTYANGRVNIRHLRGAREVRIDMNDRHAALFSRHYPAEPDRVAFGKIAALDQNAVAILQILQEGAGGTAPEACAETRHRGAVSYTGLVLDTDHAERVKELGDEIVLLIIQRCSTQRTDGKRVVDRLALFVRLLESRLARLVHTLRDAVHRPVERFIFPISAIGRAIFDGRPAILIDHQFKRSRTFR